MSSELCNQILDLHFIQVFWQRLHWSVLLRLPWFPAYATRALPEAIYSSHSDPSTTRSRPTRTESITSAPAGRCNGGVTAPLGGLVPQQDVVWIGDTVDKALAEAQRVDGGEAGVVDSQPDERQACRPGALFGRRPKGLSRRICRCVALLLLGLTDHGLHRIRQQLLNLIVVAWLRPEVFQGHLHVQRS